jgi:GTPase SAR1 family protein
MDFQQGKREVLSALREVCSLADEAGSETMSGTLRDDRIPRLEEERFHLVVLGEFNHGKTTFVNALLGESVLPMGVTPTTAVIHHIEHGASVKAVAVTGTGEEKPIPMSTLHEYVVGGAAQHDQVRYLELSYPSPLLAEGVVLVDTPGVNDLNHQRAEITYGYIPRSDAVIFLLDAGQILKESERQFIAQKLLAASRDKLLFVINKIDLLDESEKAEAIAYARKHLGEIVPNARVFAISAERALEGHRHSSGLDPFVDELRVFLQDERGRVLLDNALDQGLRIASILRTSVEVQKRAIAMDQDELDRRLASLEADLDGTSRTVEDRKAKVRESLAGVKATVRQDVEAFGDDFARLLPQEIEGSKADDLKRYLPGFIEEKFREFAEKEAATIEGRLERVAAEAIAFVTEDAEAQAERLKNALGPTASPLELKVNTFAYDVGVFALGAFGITIMAFSSLLVGGALLAAAPVLAFFVRNRADKRVRERALEEGPKAVRDAAGKLADAFDAKIDEFGDKLLEFMEKASEEMTRSIADVVRAAKRARDRGESARAELEASTGPLLARIASVEDRMKSQRNTLWASEAKSDAA